MKNTLHRVDAKVTKRQSRDEILAEFLVDTAKLSPKLGHDDSEVDSRFFTLVGLKLLAYELSRKDDNIILHKRMMTRNMLRNGGMLNTVSELIDDLIEEINHEISIKERISQSKQ
tara:strand:- start:198 stop:542 length:345 start_codon:yes stop_codon:yes gene_type:complete